MLQRKKTSNKAIQALIAYLLRMKKVVYQPCPKVWSPNGVRLLCQAAETQHTWNGGMLRWNKDCPVKDRGDKWEGIGCSVEDAEPGAVLG
jgi:hypothetical protein